jgi:hypothetical protein
VNEGVDNIKSIRAGIEVQDLRNRIKLDLNEPDYLTREEKNYQLWVNLQNDCGYFYTYDDMDLVECDPKKIGMEEAYEINRFMRYQYLNDFLISFDVTIS